MKQNCFSSFVILAAIGLTLFLISGCNKEEIQKLRSENEALKTSNETLKNDKETLKTQIASLEQEISKLKETADYHFQHGVELLKDNKYEEAKAEFNTVVEKYPESPLITPAKENLKKIIGEIRRIEAEKLAEEKLRLEEQQHQPKSEDEAIAEWKRFRQDPKKYKGTITTWRFKVTLASGDLSGFLERKWPRYDVLVVGRDKGVEKYFSYEDLALLGKLPRVVTDDWVVVTGKFVGVSRIGEIMLSTIRIKNEGYQPKE